MSCGHLLDRPQRECGPFDSMIYRNSIHDYGPGRSTRACLGAATMQRRDTARDRQPETELPLARCIKGVKDAARCRGLDTLSIVNDAECNAVALLSGLELDLGCTGIDRVADRFADHPPELAGIGVQLQR